MSVSQCRQHSDCTAQGQKRKNPNEATEETREDHRPKKQKRKHPDYPPARFWDGLSSIPLTQNALRELNRRKIVGKYSVGQEQPDTKPREASTIERFASQGGPDLTNIRGYQPPVTTVGSSQSSLARRKRGTQSPTRRSCQPSSKSITTPHTASARITGPYDRAFQQHLIDHRIYPEEYEYSDGTSPPVPENVDEILQVMARPRASLSPSRFSSDDFRKFKRADAHALKERGIMTRVIPIIEGETLDEKCVTGEVPFTNLDHITDGSLVPGNPDLYYGARPEQLDSKIRGELNGHIVPSTQTDLPIAPNFFVEVKGPDGLLSVASRQTCYNGALGARGIHSLQNYGNPELKYDNKAYTISTIYHGGQLKIYSSHPIPPRSISGEPGFVTTQLKSCSIGSDAESFRQGATAFRNAKDWTKLQREVAIEAANQRAAGEYHVPVADGSSNPIPPSEVSGEGTMISSQETISKLRSNMSESFDADTSNDELPFDLSSWRPAKVAKTGSHSPLKR